MDKELKYEIEAFSEENEDDLQKFWRLKRLETIISEVKKNSKPGQKILDCGCGAGILVNKLNKMGYHASGLDINKSFIKYAKTNFKGKFYQHDLEKPVKDIGKFDVIISSEVIEHLKETETVFNNFNSLLKNSGYLIITTPNYAGLWNIIEYLWSKKSEYDWSETHYTRFRAKILNKSLEKHGFIPKKTYSIFYLSPFVPAISYKIAEKMHTIEKKLLGPLKLGSLLISISKKD